MWVVGMPGARGATPSGRGSGVSGPAEAGPYRDAMTYGATGRVELLLDRRET